MTEAVVYVFDRFRLDVRERRLWRGDAIIPLRDKVFDTLVLLLEQPGRLQTQGDLIERLWPDVVVEPNNLQHNISILRKTLAGSPVRIETVRGRGYRFVAEVSTSNQGGPSERCPDEALPGEASATVDAPLQQRIHFCQTRDDVHLAWAELGEGPPMVKAGNWCTHLELDCSSFVWRHIIDSLSKLGRLIRYDARGNGLSDEDVAEVSFERWVSDLEAVVDAAGVRRPSLIGISQGAAVATAYAARHPERVSSLVLVCGPARGWRVKGHPKVIRHFEALLSLMEAGWGKDNPAFRQIFSTAFFPDASKAELDEFNELQRRSTTPRNAVRMLSTIGDIDIRAELPRVRAPTLVIHGRNDLVIPFSDGRELAAGISGARFVALETKSHIPLANEPAWERLRHEVERFLSESS